MVRDRLLNRLLHHVELPIRLTMARSSAATTRTLRNATGYRRGGSAGRWTKPSWRPGWLDRAENQGVFADLTGGWYRASFDGARLMGSLTCATGSGDVKCRAVNGNYTQTCIQCLHQPAKSKPKRFVPSMGKPFQNPPAGWKVCRDSEPSGPLPEALPDTQTQARISETTFPKTSVRR
jgi:hypothetical protein